MRENCTATRYLMCEMSVFRFKSKTSRRWLAPLLLLGALGCQSEKPRGEHTVGDTAIGEAGAANTGGSDTGVSRSARVSDTTTGEKSQLVDGRAGAADVIRRYYEAIRNGRYDTAYALWDGSGKASGKSRIDFANGFRQTDRTTVVIGDSVRIEGAAGSQYATVPVTVDAILRSGVKQHFTGDYTLRRSMVDGATPAQRSWRIYSAHLQQR